MPLVSIILPTRDRPVLLSRAVLSVLGQTEGDFELLVIDNNRVAPPVPESPDSIAWRGDPRVRVIRSAEASNASCARNAGLRAATGAWIAYLDDDDAYRPQKLAMQIAAAGASPVSLCGAMVHLSGRRRAVQDSSRQFLGDALLNEARWGTQLLMHRRDPALLFEEDLFAAEDLHFGLRAVARFGLSRVPVETEPLVDVYQDRNDGARTNLRGRDAWRGAKRVLWSFGPTYSRRARRIFVIRAMTARAKLELRPLRCLGLGPKLLGVGGREQVRYLLNAILVSSGWGRGRWVT